MTYLLKNYNSSENTCAFKAAVPAGNTDEVKRLVSAGYAVVSAEKYASAEIPAKQSEEPVQGMTVWDELDAAYREGVDSV